LLYIRGMASVTLIIDGSYYIFHRYFATLRWFSHQLEAGAATNTICDNEEFIQGFYRHATADFQKLKRLYECDRVLFCVDCPRAEIWRTALYPVYKGSRVLSSGFDGRIFPKFYQFLFRTHKDIEVYGGKNLEADDCAYLLSKTVAADADAIVVISNDNDYLQMKSDKIRIFNLAGDDICKRGSGDAAKDLMIKCLMGDKSDNIPPACPGIGPKTAAKLCEMNEVDRKAWLIKKGGQASIETLQRNTVLIDWTCIPSDLSPLKIVQGDENYIKTCGDKFME